MNNSNNKIIRKRKIFIFIFIFCFSSYNLWRDWRGNGHPFISDVKEYYSYIDAFFIHHDLSFSFPNSYSLNRTSNIGGVPKMSMGLAIAYTPVFLVCHLITNLTHGIADGYSEIYAFGLYYYGIILVIFGLWILSKILVQYYSESISNLVILSLFFGTNLFYYTLGWNLMSHSFLFTLYAGILYFTIKWYKSFKWKHLLIVSILCGYCTLIRPTSIFVIFISLLFGINNLNDIKIRFSLFVKYRNQFLLASITFIIPWLPQFLFWKIYTGSFMFYSYGNEGFNFRSPEIANVLLSFRKGWLVYTPIMTFALLGFYQLYKAKSGLFYPIIIYFLVTFYVLSCWWCWSWGGSFGNRGLIESYAFLALPMAAFFKKFNTIILKIVLLILISFNLLQTYQYSAVVIHWDNMTKESYKFSLFKLKYTDEERLYFNSLLEVQSDSPKTKK